MSRSIAIALSVLIASACGSTQAELSAPSSSPAPSALPAATTAPPAGSAVCTDPIKCSTPPPGYTPPPPLPCDFPLSTADEIRAAAVLMGVPPGQTPPPRGQASYGDPVLVHGLRFGDPDEWLVPLTDGLGGASQVVSVSVKSNGRGCAGMASGWSGPFPLISMTAARRRAGILGDNVATIEAVYLPWTNALPPSSYTNLVWRALRTSGYEVFLFDNGELYNGQQVRSILAAYFGSAFWRGDASPVPTRLPISPQRYPVRTANEVLAGIATDPFFVEYLRYLRDETAQRRPAVEAPGPGSPVKVQGLGSQAIPEVRDLWIVPVLDQSRNVVSVVSVLISDDGLGSAFSARGWSGPFPAVSEAQARVIGQVRDIPISSAALTWAPEFLVAPGGTSAPFWLLTLGTGDRVIVTEESRVLPASR